MPTVPVLRDELFAAMGRTYTEEEFDHLCFEYGIELDEVTSEYQMARREVGEAAAEGKDDAIIYKIDVPANRYDLLCVEGLARALRIFKGMTAVPEYKVNHVEKPLVITVAASTEVIRPFVVGAVLRNIKLNKARYNSFLDLQDKLHQNICRRRTLVAIGTHDLDTLVGPFRYEANAPTDIQFVPLGQTRKFDAASLLEFYRTDASVKHIKPYVDIIASSPVYPVIYDSNRTVLSLPPIINGDHSKMSEESRNILIECTATDRTKANIVLNTLVTMFSEHCDEPFSVEAVQIVYEKTGETHMTPDLSSRPCTANVAEINGTVGVKLEAAKIAELVTRMQLTAASYDDTSVTVMVPPTRSDVLHAVDVIEDVAIAYGYNNLVPTLPATATTGKQQALNHMSDFLRREMAQAGCVEILTMALVGRAENYSMLRREDDGRAVVLENPQSEEFEIVRTNLLGGLMKTLNSNRDASIKDGLKLFEVSDVVVKDASLDEGCRNERHLAALYTGPTAGMEIIHGIVDLIMHKLEFVSVLESPDAARTYRVRACDDKAFFAGRGGEIVIKKAADAPEEVVGVFGTLHPEVLNNFRLSFPVSAMELVVAPLLKAGVL